MGEENRRYVLTHYSVSRMTADALSVYQRICKRRAVLCGYYGFKNVGDVLLHRALTEILRKNGYRKTLTLSVRRPSLSALYSIWKGYDFFLGGGNLLQDATSRRSLSFYLFFMRFASCQSLCE
jgi:polysaccharide pyruvyl transferase WcaK-like protein